MPLELTVAQVVQSRDRDRVLPGEAGHLAVLGLSLLHVQRALMNPLPASLRSLGASGESAQGKAFL